MGQVLVFNNIKEFVVAAVAEDVPSNSHSILIFLLHFTASGDLIV
jgi:hypothetical protein